MATSSIKPGSLLTRVYENFSGVDFSKKETNLNRLPSASNVWKNYKKNGSCIETRPGIVEIQEFDNFVCNVSKYKVGNREMLLVHSGVKLYKIENGQRTTLINSGLNPVRSSSFIFNNIWYLKDGINYKKYDGQTISDVEPYIPTTYLGKVMVDANETTPSSAGTMYEPTNMLSDYQINTALGDGENRKIFLSEKNISDEGMEIKIDGVVLSSSSYTINKVEGSVVFNSAPSEPNTPGQDNISIKFKKVNNEAKNKVLKCNLVQVFDDKVFISGNVDYPNVLFYSDDSKPNYFPDTFYYNEGYDVAPIKSMVVGNNTLWVFKEPNNSNNTIFYHIPTTIVDTNGITENKYPSVHSSISLGCDGRAINFNDDIVFFSDRGMEGITGDITSEQVISHRSTLVDPSLLNMTDYKDMLLTEYEGYLLVAVNNAIYLADSRGKATNVDHYEYEWFMWTFESYVKYIENIDGVLYLGFGNKLYTLTDTSENRNINSYVMTTQDNFGYDYYQKTTNKRGSVIDIVGKDIKVSVGTDDNDLVDISTSDSDSYIVNRIKEKKFRNISFCVSSNKPFTLKRITLQAYIGNYIKR